MRISTSAGNLDFPSAKRVNINGGEIQVIGYDNVKVIATIWNNGSARVEHIPAHEELEHIAERLNELILLKKGLQYHGGYRLKRLKASLRDNFDAARKCWK